MSIIKNERTLVVVSHIASGDTDFLYQFLQTVGRTTIETLLGPHYARIVKLYDTNATFDGLVAALRSEGAKAAIKRIDLIVMLHGYRRKLAFYSNSRRSTVVLKRAIQDLNLGTKLRLLYSTACVADSHSQDFLYAGFKSAIGSLGTNANSAVEVAPLVQKWAQGAKLSDCLAPTMPLTPPMDEAARAYGQFFNTSWKDGVDSTKVLRGNSDLKITD